MNGFVRGPTLLWGRVKARLLCAAWRSRGTLRYYTTTSCWQVNWIVRAPGRVPMPRGKGALSLVYSLISTAWRMAVLAEEGIAEELASLRELVARARKALASGDSEVALGYIDSALQRLRAVRERLQSETCWLSDKLEVFLGQAASLLEQVRDNIFRASLGRNEPS
ncbi:hypothetical protein PABY_00690 [Pyrodictium abyssi]|uniref:Uncharacterized protein n=2 Tax=Pyrodictium abyssi TaxID=54256 RepID=A0ABN6ZJS1_9CREN|nr:hypothetical protein PABY_00690 [Pyrodictium abyssi]